MYRRDRPTAVRLARSGAAYKSGCEHASWGGRCSTVSSSGEQRTGPDATRITSLIAVRSGRNADVTPSGVEQSDRDSKTKRPGPSVAQESRRRRPQNRLSSVGHAKTA